MHQKIVILHGDLGRRFGRTHRVFLDTNLPSELMSYFRNQFRGFAAYMAQSKDRGVGYQVIAGNRELNHDGMACPLPGELVRIAPRIVGAKNGGVFNIILGAVLVAVGVVADIYAPGNPVSTYLYSAGASMILGGVVQLLSPVPKGLAAADSPNNTASYAFNGPVNTEAQGNPVPLLIGELIVGSAVISAGIDTSDTAYVPTTPGIGSMGTGGGGTTFAA